jgi:hypothetical protein
LNRKITGIFYINQCQPIFCNNCNETCKKVASSIYAPWQPLPLKSGLPAKQPATFYGAQAPNQQQQHQQAVMAALNFWQHEEYTVFTFLLFAV